MAKTQESVTPLRILLSNGRFPVALDLARQLWGAGHTIYVVDAMHYHICKFSRIVKKSFWVPAPHSDAAGYVAGVKGVVRDYQIDLIIPLHEEIFYLAECGDSIILDKLFAPPFRQLLRLHHKFVFNKFLLGIGLDAPETYLCCSMADVEKLDRTREWAVKPVFGRGATNVFHLKPDKPFPSTEILGVSDEKHFVAQEWLYGIRYCSYSVIRDGRQRALSIYPVEDTIDGSSCVYFESTEHPGIHEYVDKISAAHPDMSGQLAFDFIVTDSGRLVAIDSNPRATSGIHLFAGNPCLARCITGPARAEDDEGETLLPISGANRMLAPGMMMVPIQSHPSVTEYFRHLWRLVSSRDATFSWSDLIPSLMQPCLLTSYYEICREKGGISIQDMFQDDVVWEPTGEHLQQVRRMLKEFWDEDFEKGLVDGTGGFGFRDG